MPLHRSTHRSGTTATIGVAGLIAIAALVTMLGREGAFSVFGTAAATIAPPIPGVTLDDSTADRTPIVTSLRTHSEAQRRGIQVGDRIHAVDGRAVRDLAALRAAVAQHPGTVPVSLEIQRGDALWDVALDRSEPDGSEPGLAVAANDPENPAGRGR